jgi:hypothetical protein
MEKYFVVIVTNGFEEKIQKVPYGFATNIKMAERMVSGLLNNSWRVIERRSKFIQD